MTLFNIFTDGDLVPTSGVYAALHSTPHKLIEREIYAGGDRFHHCRLCPFGVLYRLETPSVPTASKGVLATEKVAIG